LPPERIAEVEAFIDLITQQNIAAARHEAIAAYAAPSMAAARLTWTRNLKLRHSNTGAMKKRSDGEAR
jgi:hypothetical protein